MFDLLPSDPDVLKHWSWTDFEPYYTDLAKRNVTADKITEFLSDWTRVGFTGFGFVFAAALMILTADWLGLPKGRRTPPQE